MNIVYTIKGFSVPRPLLKLLLTTIKMVNNQELSIWDIKPDKKEVVLCSKRENKSMVKLEKEIACTIQTWYICILGMNPIIEISRM